MRLVEIVLVAYLCQENQPFLATLLQIVFVMLRIEELRVVMGVVLRLEDMVEIVVLVEVATRL